MSRLRLRLLALFVALAVLGSSTAAASIVYVCRMSGQAGPSCCCKASSVKAQAQKRSKAPAVDRPACCRVEISEAAVAPVTSPSAERFVFAATLAEVRPLLALGAGVERTPYTWDRWRAPPERGPPIYLEHCALLN